MSKKKREQTSSSTETVATDVSGRSSRPLVPVLLIGISALASLLALFQWMELLVVRAGGTAVCAVSEVLDCQKIWDSPFAVGVHSALGVPVAGFGLVWALAAFGVSLAWAHRLLSGRSGDAPAAALKIVAWAGVATIPVLAAVSFSAGAVCLACTATYAVVTAFAVVALKLVPGGLWPAAPDQLKGGGMWAAGLAAVAYLVLLGPGLATPKSAPAGGSSLSNLPTANNGAVTPPAVSDPAKATPPASTQNAVTMPASDVRSGAPLSAEDQAIANFLESLGSTEKQMVANGIAMYAGASTPAGTPPSPRRLYGAATAPVKVVEWVDFRCGACRHLNETMKELKRVAPEGSFSVEARNFPLDSECNPNVQMSDKLGIRCLAAKASICLEPTRDFWTVRDSIFASQQNLTPEKIMELATAGSMSRKQLEACLKNPETDKKLREDIEYAMRYNPGGTPLLVVNGRETMAGAAGPLLYALSLTGGNVQSPAFRALPQPRAMDPHAGHNHGPGGHHGAGGHHGHNH